MKQQNPPIASTSQPQSSGSRIRRVLVAAGVIRKTSPSDLVLRQLREYFLYSKLRSLLPPDHQPLQQISSCGGGVEMPTEFEPPYHEIPDRDSDEENPTVASSPSSSSDDDEEDDDGVCENDDDEEKVEEKAEMKNGFDPSIKIKRMEDALLISIVVLKRVALSSGLFRLLEEEKLDILFENQYRTETKVSHTIQVRVPAEYDVDALERKLQTWGRTGMDS